MSSTAASSRSWFRNARARLFDSERLVAADQTPYEVLGDDGLVKLRYYPPLRETDISSFDDGRTKVEPRAAQTPLVIVSPLAVNMSIYDLFPERSLVRYLRARGFELYLVDWGRPSRRDDRLGLASYFADYLPRLLGTVRKHSGEQRVSLHGWSFGGLFSLCHAALSKDVANLVLVGAPFDYHRNGKLGRVYRRVARHARWLGKRSGVAVHRTSPSLWRAPGWANSLAFKLTNPVASARGYWQLLERMHDDELVRAHATNGVVLDDMVAYPGRVIQDIVHYLMIRNVLPNGSLPMKDAPAGPTDVTANVLNITGRKDVIVTPECSQAMRDRIGSNDKTFTTIDGGHVSIVSGAASQRNSWGAIAEWLLARD